MYKKNISFKTIDNYFIFLFFFFTIKTKLSVSIGIKIQIFMEKLCSTSTETLSSSLVVEKAVPNSIINISVS